MFTFRQAKRDDADQIGDILIASSGGLAKQLLGGLIPGLKPRSILSAALSQGEGVYDLENIICSYEGEHCTGLLFSYPSEQHKVPALMESFIPSKRLKPVRLLLEKSLPDSLHINTLWTAEPLRNNALADALLVEAESRCRALGLQRLCLFCWNDDAESMSFFASHGFAMAEHFPGDTLPVEDHAQGASLLCRPLHAG